MIANKVCELVFIIPLYRIKEFEGKEHEIGYFEYKCIMGENEFTATKLSSQMNRYSFMFHLRPDSIFKWKWVRTNIFVCKYNLRNTSYISCIHIKGKQPYFFYKLSKDFLTVSWSLGIILDSRNIGYNPLLSNTVIYNPGSVSLLFMELLRRTLLTLLLKTAIFEKPPFSVWFTHRVRNA